MRVVDMAILVLREISTSAVNRRATPMQAQGLGELAAGRLDLPADPIRYEYRGQGHRSCFGIVSAWCDVRGQWTYQLRTRPARWSRLRLGSYWIVFMPSLFRIYVPM